MASKLNRRRFLGAAATVLGGTALAACQPQVVEKVVKETVPVKETVQAEVKETVIVEKHETVEINFWGWTGLVYDDMMKEFAAQYPYIKVNLSEIGENVFGDQKFMTAVAAGQGPSVAIQNKHTFAQFAAKGMYQDVTPFMDKYGMKRDDFFKMQINEVTWAGKVYGLPEWGAVRYLHWNRQHFQEVGLDPDTPPTTYAELEEFAARLNKKDSQGNFERIGFVPYLVGNNWLWLYGGLNKAPALSADKRTVLCDDPRWVEALDWLVSFYDQYIGSFELANAFSEGISAAGLGDPFTAGKVSMQAAGDWDVAGLLRIPDLDWMVAPMPIPPNGQKYSWSCGYTVVMPPSARYPEAAWTLMTWWINEDGWRARAKAELADIQRTWEREKIEGEPIYWPADPDYIPAYKMVTEEVIAKMPDKLKKVWDIGQDMLMNYSSGCGTDLMGLAALDYWVEMDNATRAALSHKMSPKEALDNCKAKVQEATDRAWQAIDQQNA